ncbi:MAG: hypothetical protein Q8N18_21440 [Opitutaceae bacterium]|nr:hypothetical protein [Opitutaceae bacterium]
MKSSFVSLLALATAALSGAAAEPAAHAPSLDAFGGWTNLKGRATGWFHLESFNGRTLLVTPAGHGFVALGVNHLNAVKSHGPDEPDLFRTRYGGDWEKYAAEVLRYFDAWGLNTVDEGVEPLRRVRPYFAGRDFVATAKYKRPPGEPGAWEFPDVFDPAVVARLERDVEAFCREHRDNKNLIAYYWTDTPTWDVRKTRVFRQTDWVSEIRKLAATAAGKQRYARFLGERHGGDLARVNRAYGLSLQSFADLPGADFAGVDLNRYEVARDDEVFLGLIAREYYGIVGPAMRRHDPHHLVFGEKYLLGDIPSQVLAAAVPHVDAIAVQPGDGYIPIYTPGDIFPRDEFAELHALSGKPIMICDHQIGFPSARYPRSIWPYHLRANEAEAAAATERFMREAFACAYIVGYMRCQYIDRFADRRGAIKLGLLRDDSTPYVELVAATTRASVAIRRDVFARAENRSRETTSPPSGQTIRDRP